MNDKLVRFGVSLEQNLLDSFDRLITRWDAPSRSEAIRDLIRARLVEESLTSSSSEVVGTITVLYDHHKADVTRAMTDYQHSHIGIIITTVHIHLDEHNCLEVIVARSDASTLNDVARKIIHMKVVKQGAVSFTSAHTGTE